VRQEHGHGRGDEGDRRQVAIRIESHLLLHVRRDRERPGCPEQQGMTVGRCPCDELGGDVAACAAAVVDHDLLAEAFRKLLRDHARHRIARAARRETDDEAQRPRRILGRSCRRRGCGEHDHERARQ
jgi:hypothetical protein